MKTLGKFFLILFGLFLAAGSICGCGAMQRDQLKKRYYNTWPRHIQDAVDKGEVAIGMNKLQVQIATGVSESIVQKRTNISAYGVDETWVLWKFMGMWGFYPAGGAGKMVLLHFDGGVVDRISY